ncbi:cytochrome P450 4C1-like [Phymastichus coffea]|uniref:cytochrome P450 4C1-like n=1 Tax=Phymastichus coffea TaxID=108790 RepID=UPI00273B6768|nr:cytochrome P450 4C1-like [Phymastichus coffea]
MLIELSLFVLLLFCWHKYHTEYSRIGKYIRNIPGPPIWPLLGCLPNFMQGKLFPTQETIWQSGRDFDLKYYPTYKFWDTHRACVIILHPDNIEKLFTSMRHIQKSFLYNTLHGWLGTGLLTSHGTKWQTRRKMLTPAFHFNILQQYFKNIVENGEKTMEQLLSKGEAIYDVDEVVSNFTLKVICETAMGVKFTEENINEYRKAIHCVGSSAVYRSIYPWFGPESIFRMTQRGREYKQALNTLHSFTKKIIQERKEFHDNTNGYFLEEFASDGSKKSLTDDIYHGYRKKRLAMLDLLIAAQRDNQQIDDQGIQEEVDTFTFEGHDTSAVALMFAVLLIAEHEDVQNRIRREVSEILDRTNGKLEMSDVQNLHYLEMCLKECLRLHPSVPYMSRYMSEDLQLTDYLIPKGTLVQIHTYSVHRLPEFWPDPEKFDPERFSPENSVKRHPFSYIPFSAGPRNCIGQKFAMIQLKVFIAYLIYNFYLKPVIETKEIKFITDIIHRPSRPTYVKLAPINK